MTDKIRIAGLTIACIVGIRPAERHRPQPVRINLELALDLAQAGKSGRIVHTVDYSRVALEIESLLRFRAYKLVEVAAEEIAAALLAMHASIEQLTLQIEKPEALRGLAQGASVEITRRRSELELTRLATGGCEVELRLRTHEAELSVLTIDAQSSLAASHSPRGRRIEWLTSGSLLADGRELALLSARSIEGGRQELLENQGSERAVLFRCAEIAPLNLDFSQGP